MTGGGATHDAILWGTGPEAAERRAAGTPLLKVPMSSELGCVTPFIITPGAWTRKQLELQANHVAGAMGRCAGLLLCACLHVHLYVRLRLPPSVQPCGCLL